LRRRQMSAFLLIAASLLAIAVGFFNPHLALWAFMLPLVAPPVMRRVSAMTN
jgi:hypothetical protein